MSAHPNIAETDPAHLRFPIQQVSPPMTAPGTPDTLQVVLDHRQLDRLCPFFLLVDSALTIVGTGDRMHYVLPDLASAPYLEEVFDVQDWQTTLSFDRLVAGDGERITLALRALPHIRFCGAIVPLPDLTHVLLPIEPVAASGSPDMETGPDRVSRAAGTLEVPGNTDTVETTENRDLETLRVLVIDDNEVSRSVLAAQLRGTNMLCDTSRSGAYGLARMRDSLEAGKPYDCVFVDMEMPELSGIDVARFIRADDRFGETRLILLTTFSDPWPPSDLAAAGFCRQLVKPVQTNTLLTMLRQMPASACRHRQSPVQQHSVATTPDPLRETALSGHLSPGRNPIDILVVEDNAVNQLVIEQILGRTEYTYSIIASSKQAMMMIETQPPRLVFMDTSLPDMNGFEATKTIRALEADSGHRVPIVGLVADVLSEYREACLTVGMDDCLTKPVSPDHVAGMIEKWLGDSRPEDVPAAAS